MARQIRNFVVKTIDGRGVALQKALKAAGIEVLSVFEIYKEVIPEEPEAGETPEDAPAGDTAGDPPADTAE